jgi:hypothetical protein
MDMSTAAPGYRRQQWNAHSKPERITAALLALVITLAIPGLLHERNHGDNFGTANTVLNVRLIPNHAAAITSRITPAPTSIPTSARRPEVTSASTSTTKAPVYKLEQKTVRPDERAPLAAGTEPEMPSLASTPLQIDSKAIRKAYQDSKSEIEKLGERSGKLINDKPLTKFDRFESAVNQAAKPECISQDTAGAGLLAIPLVAYWLVTDKCK